MLRTIHLHGRLGKKYGRRFELAVTSPGEAIRALASQISGFADYIRDRHYVVTVGDGAAIPEEALTIRLGSMRDIHIVPASPASGTELILLGATLLLTAATAVFSVLNMPKAAKASSREEGTKVASFMFDGATNVTEQGHPVPLIYGRFRAGSVVASAGISTTDANVASVSANPTNPTYTGAVSAYAGFIGATAGIKGSAAGNEWVLSKGGKGGSTGARSAQEDPNTLQSQATARIIDVISEGEVVGLVDGLRSIYFDETPVQNPDGSFNFAGVSAQQRVGLPDQDFVPGFSQTERTVEVNTKVSIATGPITQTITDADVTLARVTIRLPQLYAQDTTNGDLKSSNVSVAIYVQADGGGFTKVTQADFVGKTNSGYQRSIDVRLPVGNTRQIRVVRLTPDSTLSSLQNETIFDLLTEIVEAKLTYPDTALIALTVDARQFGSSIPTRSYDIKGLIIEVPSNYNPVTRVYTGIWDGTFKRAWSDCPPWILRDLLVNRRYGLGARIPKSAIDIWGLYEIARYCDGMVPDMKGGMEPRYTINCCINNAAAAYDLLASIASAFRGFVYWGSGAIMATQDRPEDPSILVTPSNVVDGKIKYGRGTPAERRRSAAVVYWNDPSDGYKLVPEIYEDPVLIRRFGRRTGDEVTAFGCTSQGLAHRFARWLIEDEAQGSNSTASYAVGDDHGFVEPGRIASIADPMFTQSRRGGRVRVATANGVQIDAPFNFITGPAYKLRVMLPNGSVSVRPITNAAGATNLITLGGAAYPVPPNPGAVWTIETDTVANRQWKIRSLETDEAPYEVQAVLHDPTKYDRVELDSDIETPNFLDLPTGPLIPPSAIVAYEFLLQDGNASIPCVQVSWAASPDPRVTFYQAQFQRPGSNWEAFSDSVDVSRVVRGVEAGTWLFRVRALDSLGNKTAWLMYGAPLSGQAAAVPNVLGLTIVTDDKALATRIVWLMPADTRPLRAEVLFAANPAAGIASAVQLAIVDTQEYPITATGRYWVRLRFIDAVSGSPPSVLITAANLPVVRYDDGKAINDLKPAEAGATKGAPAGTYVGDKAAEEVVSQLNLNGFNALYATALGTTTAALLDAVRNLEDGSALTVKISDLTSKVENPDQNAIQTLDLIGSVQPNGNGGKIFVIGQNTAIAGTDKLLGQTIDSIESQVKGHEASITSIKEIVTTPNGSSELRALTTLNEDGVITGTINTLTGGRSKYAILADEFRIVSQDNANLSYTPFSVIDGVVTMLDVVITKLRAGSVTITSLAAGLSNVSRYTQGDTQIPQGEVTLCETPFFDVGDGIANGNAIATISFEHDGTNVRDSAANLRIYVDDGSGQGYVQRGATRRSGIVVSGGSAYWVISFSAQVPISALGKARVKLTGQGLSIAGGPAAGTVARGTTIDVMRIGR